VSAVAARKPAKTANVQIAVKRLARNSLFVRIFTSPFLLENCCLILETIFKKKKEFGN